MEKINGLTLEEWTNQVDAICEKQYGLTAMDLLGDHLTYDNWSEGISPQEYWDNDLKFEVAESVGHLSEAFKDF